MVIRLLLLSGLLLGLVTPPVGEGADHCRAHAGMTTGNGAMEHHGAPGPQHGSAPVDHQGCPPTHCVLAVHCQAIGATAIVAGAFRSPVASTSGLAPRTSHFLVSRALEPPTPPPNRSA